MASKTLHFYSHGLRGETTVMFMLEIPSSSKIFREQFPVVWKVITLPAGGDGMAHVDYVSHLGYSHAKTGAGYLVESTSWVEVRAGDISGTSGGSGSKLIVCKNNTRNRVNLSIGFVKGNGVDEVYEPILFCPGVSAGSSITTKFTPTLTAYITREYNESQMLHVEVCTDAIWSQNLNELDDVTGWNLIEDEESGQFTIVSASRV
ncbi:hypothetical protein BDV93DRAFT_525264 [Ceratobasidium sp. AG-I]|nr:hypothetical protein BDV93DRAFT_525264 [Ceratobasidium sp. AG-I]